MRGYLLKVVLSKEGFSSYLSQLDLVRVLERALRRMDLPLVFKGRFRVRPKLRFGKALKLGEEGEIEVIFFFSTKINSSFFKKKLKENLPQGLKIIKVYSLNEE